MTIETICNQEHTYLVFMDEVGDVKCHPRREYNNPSVFPIHTITAIAIPRTVYRDFFVPGLNAIKRKYFGDASIQLHSREIRKRNGIFKVLSDTDTNTEFHGDMRRLMDRSEMVITSSSINKIKLIEKAKEFEVSKGINYSVGDLYLRNFEYALERVGHYIGPHSAQIIFETRGREESRRVQGSLEKLQSTGSWYHSHDRFTHFAQKVFFFTKDSNINGLQVADYCAYPFAVHCRDESIENDTFEQLYKYVYKGNYGVYGLKEWP